MILRVRVVLRADNAQAHAHLGPPRGGRRPCFEAGLPPHGRHQACECLRCHLHSHNHQPLKRKGAHAGRKGPACAPSRYSTGGPGSPAHPQAQLPPPQQARLAAREFEGGEEGGSGAGERAPWRPVNHWALAPHLRHAHPPAQGQALHRGGGAPPGPLRAREAAVGRGGTVDDQAIVFDPQTFVLDQRKRTCWMLSQ